MQDFIRSYTFMYKEAKLDSTIMACDFYYMKMYYMHVHASI